MREYFGKTWRCIVALRKAWHCLAAFVLCATFGPACAIGTRERVGLQESAVAFVCGSTIHLWHRQGGRIE